LSSRAWTVRLRPFALLLLTAPVLYGCQIADWAGYGDAARLFSPKPATLSLIPEPASVTRGDGHFIVASGTPLLCAAGDEECAWIAGYVSGLLKRSRGLSLAPGSGDVAAPPHEAIVFRRIVGMPSQEGYRLDVTLDGVVVSAGTRAGLFYGGITLWQLLTQNEGEASRIEIPALHIADAPRFAWRGMLLDSVRHFQTAAFVKSFIDAMALHKLNVLQWHLTDDQGWRIEIKRYPRLTSVGAWRVPAGHAAQTDIDPATGRPRLYGGFYTQDEIRDIVAYAAQRNVTIVPEIEMPGHAMAAIVAYPELGSVKNPPIEVSSDWGVFPYLYNVDDSTFDFLENVLTEVMGLFPSEYIHVGGDEAIKHQWKASPEVQARMHALGIANEDALQGYFTARIGAFLEAHGRRLIGWDEILEGGVPPDATITSWRGIDGAITAAKTGHDAVLSPAPTLYFDNRQAEGASEPPGRGAIVSLKDVYDFDPAPASLTPEQQAHIIGLQANIWTEHIREEDLVDYAAFPRAAALAERAWSPEATHDWNDFFARIPAQLARYRDLGIVHSESAVTPPVPLSPLRRDSHELEPCSKNILLSLEDDAPLNGPRARFLVDISNPCWIWPQAKLDGIASIKAGVGQVPFNFQIGADKDKIPLLPPKTPDGELEVHLDDCKGAPIADLPLAPAAGNDAVTALSGPLAAQHGAHDLCFVFTRKSVDPIWAIDQIELVPQKEP
jgi:hexosaminidase